MIGVTKEPHGGWSCIRVFMVVESRNGPMFCYPMWCMSAAVCSSVAPERGSRSWNLPLQELLASFWLWDSHEGDLFSQRDYWFAGRDLRWDVLILSPSLVEHQQRWWRRILLGSRKAYTNKNWLYKVTTVFVSFHCICTPDFVSVETQTTCIRLLAGILGATGSDPLISR